MNIQELLFELNSLKMRYECDIKFPDVRLISTRNDTIIYFDGNIIFADRIDNFDKPSKCPVKLPAPQDEEQLEYLEIRLNWLASDEGLEYSKNNGYTDIEVYPYDNYYPE
jgi:hypothetical protein